jgi:hypothetical protein
MKRLMTVCACLLTLTLIGADALAAEQAPPGQMQMGGQAGQPQPPGQPPATGGEMMGQGMMSMMTMMHQMMHQMMGGQMGSGGMGMRGTMGGGTMDPKTMGRMLQMRGEMLKAMGDILLKYGKQLEEGK